MFACTGTVVACYDNRQAVIAIRLVNLVLLPSEQAKGIVIRANEVCELRGDW